MGEARDRMLKGLPPRILKPGDQIQIDVKDIPPKKCECGCQYFIPVVEIYVVSALVSPTGQEMIAQKPILVCVKCKTALGNKEVTKPEEGGNNAPTDNQ